VSILHLVRRIANVTGIDVTRLRDSHPGCRRVQLLKHHGVTLVWDVGANDGGYAGELRRFGYQGRIVSFEPVHDAYRMLKQKAARDSKWTILPYALGANRAEATINVAGNRGASSSFLPMLDRHRTAAPDSTYVGIQAVQVHRLDAIWQQFANSKDRMFLKIDVQGFERQVLDGAAEILDICIGLQLELSFVPLYDGGMTDRDALAFVTSRGFTVMSLEPGFTDRQTGQMLQADAVFFKARHEPRRHDGGMLMAEEDRRQGR
jgi:FkbM family methyltransferase